MLRFSPTEGMQSRHAPLRKPILLSECCLKTHIQCIQVERVGCFCFIILTTFPFSSVCLHIFYKSTKSHLKEQLKKNRDDENNRAEELTYMTKMNILARITPYGKAKFHLNESIEERKL